MTSTNTKASAYLGGKPLLASSPVRWTLKEGVTPVTETFDMAPADALELGKIKKAITLEIRPVTGNPVIVKNLWVLNISPGDNPFISKVTVADRRWFWSYGHIGPDYYNMRRNVAVKRVLANNTPDFAFVTNGDTAALVQYWNASLDGQKPWVPLRLIQDVMDKVSKIEKDYAGTTYTYKIDNLLANRIQGLPVEELLIDDQGDRALDRAVAYLPEAGITVDYDGTVIVFSKASGLESDIVRALVPEVRNEGHTDLVKNNLIRPKEVHVLFTREVEVRWDFIEEALAQSGTTTDISDGTLRRFDNVLPITDYQLTVRSQPLPQGTWITMDDAFRAFGTIPLVGVPREIDHDLVQRAMIPGMDLWENIGIFGDRPDQTGSLMNWVGRISAIQNHYRRTFRINRRWMDRILSLRAYRLGTIDPQSGQRGPAQAFGDYSIMATQRSVWRNRAQGKPLDWAINRSAYPSSGILDSTASPSPAEVSIIDHDQGIIHVDYKVDPNRVYEMILPSQIDIDSMPTADITQKNRSITFNSVFKATKAPRLSPSFKMAVIMTAVPGTKHQLHRIVVKPSDVRSLVPVSDQDGLDECDGPIMEIRIGSNVEVARVRWLDSEASTIERIFQVPVEGPPPEDSRIKALTLNDNDSTDLSTGGSLNRIAKARAAAVYASLVDRYEGSMAGAMNGGVHLAGWATEVAHELRPSGEALTTVSMPTAVPQFDLLSFLDSNTRAAILRLVQPL